MADEAGGGRAVNVPLMIALGLGAGAVLGLALARRAAQRSRGEVAESVEELKRRTQKVLSDLSGNVADLLDQSRASVTGAEEA